MSAKTRDSKNPSALVPHFDAVRSIIEIDHVEGKRRGRSRGGRSRRNHAGDFASSDESVRTPILSRLAMILERHPGSVPPLEFYATSSLSFVFVSIRIFFSLYLLRSVLHFILFSFFRIIAFL